MRFVDSHCHLNFPELAGDLAGILDRMTQAEVSHALCVSVSLETFPEVLGIAERYPNIFASVGVHPDQTDGAEPEASALVRAAVNSRVVAIGETGLDYYRIEGALEWQRERFRTHIRAARKVRKPLIVHTRDAADDTMRVMREESAGEAGGVMHCFTEAWPVAKAALDQGFYISFSGILTFKSAAALREVAAQVPLEHTLIEQIDDGGVGVCGHLGGKRLGEKNGGAKVHRELMVPAGTIEATQPIRDEFAGIVDEERKRPNRICGRGDQPAHRLVIGEIGDQHGSVSAARHDFAMQLLRLHARIVGMNGDGVTPRGEPENDGAADALRTARHQRGARRT